MRDTINRRWDEEASTILFGRKGHLYRIGGGFCKPCILRPIHLGDRPTRKTTEHRRPSFGNSFVQQHVCYWYRYQRQECGTDQPADNHGGQFRANQSTGITQRQRKQGENRGERGHQDGTQSRAACKDHRVKGSKTLGPQLANKSNQHYGVGHHDSDEEKKTHQRRQAQRMPRDGKCDQSSDDG